VIGDIDRGIDNMQNQRKVFSELSDSVRYMDQLENMREVVTL